MSTNSRRTKALVSVFDNFESAGKAVLALREAGYAEDRVELVTYDIHDESPQVRTPNVQASTASSMMESAGTWGGVGLGTGATAGVVAAAITGFPGLALGMLVVGGLTGAIMGGMAGVDRAVSDDSIDLPPISEYEQLLKAGNRLVVVHGTHEEVMAARDVIDNMFGVRSHLHTLHGHDHHEHSSEL